LRPLTRAHRFAINQLFKSFSSTLIFLSAIFARMRLDLHARGRRLDALSKSSFLLFSKFFLGHAAAHVFLDELASTASRSPATRLSGAAKAAWPAARRNLAALGVAVLMLLRIASVCFTWVFRPSRFST